MPSSLDSIRPFAGLVWLLVYRAASTTEQKQALRSALAAMRPGGVSLSLLELNRWLASISQRNPVPPELHWLVELSARMAGHSVAGLNFAPQTRAADVLGVARVLALPPVAGDEGVHFDSRVRSLELASIDIKYGGGGFVRRATPIAVSRVVLAPPAETPPMGIGAISATVEGEGASRSGVKRSTERTAKSDASKFEDDTSYPLGHEGGRDEQVEMLTLAFTRRELGRGVAGLLRALDGTLTPDSASQVLDDLSRAGEDLARERKWEELAVLLGGVIARERVGSSPEVRRVFTIHLRRLSTPAVLREIAQLAARRRDLREVAESLFVRVGEVAAEVLIEQMVASTVTSERRAYRSMIARCPQAADALEPLLGDSRWYVVRNAAELLGEMNVVNAAAGLIDMLKHSDARVRRAAVGALSRLGATRGVVAMQSLIGDPNAGVRLQVAHGLATARLPRTVPALLQALDREGDPEIRHALLHALAACPTDPAVEALADAARPGSLLNRKPTAFRLAAVHALGEAATRNALAVLRQLQSDKDREVRQAAERALMARAEGATMEAVTGR